MPRKADARLEGRILVEEHGDRSLALSAFFEQVHGSRERWVRVIDAIPDSIIVHNPEGNIVRINRPLAARLGVHPSS